MSDTAAHLVEAVLPVAATYRQWVCTVPFSLRMAVGFDRRLCADVLAAFIDSLLRHLRWRVKRAFGLEGVADAKEGAITFIQRFDSALRLAPHFHCLVPDGAWVVTQGEEARLCALPDPCLPGPARARGQEVMWGGRPHKVYCGMGSIGALQNETNERYGKHSNGGALVPEGVEGMVPQSGSASELLYQLLGGLRKGMGYCGLRTVAELKTGARFIRVSNAAMRESHAHDVKITKEAPNYWRSTI